MAGRDRALAMTANGRIDRTWRLHENLAEGNARAVPQKRRLFMTRTIQHFLGCLVVCAVWVCPTTAWADTRVYDSNRSTVFIIDGDRVYDKNRSTVFIVDGDRVYDKNRNTEFIVDGDRIYDRNRSTLMILDGDRVYDKNRSTLAILDGDRIYDKNRSTLFILEGSVRRSLKAVFVYLMQ